MKTMRITLAAFTLAASGLNTAQAGVLWVGYGKSNQAKQGDVEGRGYDIEDYSKSFNTYSGSVFLNDAAGVSGYVDQNDDNDVIGYRGTLRVATHALEWERGWQKGQLEFEDQLFNYRSDFMKAGIFEYAEDAEGLEVGLVYYRKTKPTMLKADGATQSGAYLDDEKWIDPEMKYELYGFELRYDSVRNTMDKLVATGKSVSSADWYFSFTHIQGIGHIRTSKSVRNKPQSSDQYKGDEEWWGFLAAQGRYQFGLAYIKAAPGWALSLDAGVFADLSLPLGLHKDMFSKDKNVPQQERFSTGWEARAGLLF